VDRRLRLATISAVFLAVVLLGIPCGFLAAQATGRAAMAEVQRRCDSVAGFANTAADISFVIKPEDLETFTGQDSGGLTNSVEVKLEDGQVIKAGPALKEPLRVVYSAANGPVVTCAVSWVALQIYAARAIVLVALVAIVAIAAGWVVATRQARRLTRPLIYLAASAEQLGAGRVRPHLSPTGIEEIDLVADELARSADRMARRLAAERQFASDASHQLRTPLTALSMRLEEIEMLTDSAEVRDEAQRSLEQIDRLASTINELLGRSSREGESDTVEALRLVDIAAQQEDEWAVVFASEGRELVVDVPWELGVLATPGALAQVVATLIENSLKHGGGRTTVRAAKASGGVSLEVADEGEGVSDEMAPHIFERHVTSGGGTGLGLALARDLAAHDGGRLELAQRRPAVFRLFLRAAVFGGVEAVVFPEGEEVNPV